MYLNNIERAEGKIDEEGDVILQDMVTFDDTSPQCIYIYGSRFANEPFG